MNWKRIIILLLMASVLFLALSATSASDNLDNTTVSVTDYRETIETTEEYELEATPGTFSELSGKIRSAGGALVLDKNYTYSSADSADGIEINKDMTIDGAGYTINGANKASIFKISGNSHVILRNVNFINAYGTYGSAISLSAGDNVEIINSKFINNAALNDGGAIYISSASNITANSKITNSLFINNRAENGGAIYASGTLFELTDSTFTSNNASDKGGSIFFDVGAFIDNCIFTDSHADADGGAIYYYSIVSDFSVLPAQSRKYGIFNTRLISCSAGHDGGSAYIYGSYGIVNNITVIGCSAENDAGVAFIDGDRGQLLNSTFINNTAGHNGGAIVWSGINGMIYGCKFINNTAEMGSGAGLYQKPSADVSVFDGISIINASTFINNVAYTNGGAVYVSGIFAVIHHSLFRDDEARDGAGIYLDVGASIEYCTLIGEKAKNNGGGIYLSASNIDTTGVDPKYIIMLRDNVGVRHSSIINCSASYDGGAGYVAGDNGFVVNLTMIGNSAGHDGGAGYIAGSFGSLYNSTMINNRAARDGGALMWAGDGGKITNVTCMVNRADGGSGSICVRGDNISISQSNFMLSNATLNGGAIYVYGDNVNITDSLFDRCAATAYHGGAISISGANTLISGCNFDMNRVNVGVGRGGAINIQGENTKIINSNFDRCTAAEGGFIYIDGTNTEIVNVSGNRSFATTGGAFYIMGDNATIMNAECFHNNATNVAGAIYVAGNYADISNIHLARNIAYNGDGGAIYITGLNTTISNANMVQNRVTGGNARGGAIYVKGDYTKILNSTFDMCTAYEGGVIYIDGSYALLNGYSCIRSLAFNDGGAIYVAGHHATIENFNISMTNSTGYGGAIFVKGDNLNILNSNFTLCTAYDHNGGALYIMGLNTTISQSHFQMNRVNDENGRGGSIGIQGDFTRILNCTFARCNAYEGGVIYINGSNTLIDGYSCLMSFASNNGGAIYVAGDYASIADFDISLTNATNYGGAIYVAGDFTNIHNSNFTRCIADNYHGGALYIAGFNTTVSDSHFVQNRVNEVNGRGGSIGIHGDFTKILNSSFMMCTAYDGGVVYINGSNTLIDGYSCLMSFASNNGGAIYVAGDYASIADFDISLTNATNYGGAIYVAGDFTNIHNSNFTRCIADNYHGGALYIAGLNATVSDSHFVQNRVNEVNGRGGSIGIHGDFTKILNSSFMMCTAYDGGVVYINGSNTLIDGYSCLMSFASNNGGAIYVAGDYASIADFDISLTNATNYGGAIYVAGDFTNIHNSNFTRCIADNYHGGALYIAGLNATVSDSHFVQNRVNEINGRGGSVEIQGNYTNLLNCSFIMCTAYEGGVVYINGSHINIDGFNSNMTLATNDGGALYVAGDYVTLNNFYIGFTNATNNGGAIYITGDDDVNILNGNLTTAIAVMGHGGAIYAGGYNSTISGCDFDRTKAVNGYGGAIYIAGDLASLTDSNFARSFAYDGGILYVLGQDASISNNNLTYCWSINEGGAVYIEGDNVQIRDSTFAYSNASLKSYGNPGFGGALYIDGDNVNVSSSVFYMCTAEKGGSGGAIFIMGENVNIELSNFTKCVAPDYPDGQGGFSAAGAIAIAGNDASIIQSNFEMCFARNGGVIFIEGTGTDIIDSNITNCFALSDGGALYIYGEHTNISGTTFKNVHSQGKGGAIYIRFGEYANIEDSTFINCRSTTGGAIDIDGNHVKISKSSLTECSAVSDGGAIYVSGNDVTISESDFANCKAENGNAGAIYWIGSVGLVDGCTFTNNTAPGLGGAVFLRDNSYTVFANDKFVNNTAGINGGAIDFNRGAHDGVIINSTFANNLANRSAGAVFWFGTKGSIKGSKFINNTALGITEYRDSYGNLTYGGYGGAVMWTGSDGIVEDCEFISNSVAKRGGAVYLQGSDVGNCTNTTFNRCVFTDNVAGTNGGAVDWHEGASDGNIFNSTFENNVAHANGGAVYWRGHDGEILDSNFTNNTAKGERTGSYGNAGDGGAIFWAGVNGMVYNCRFTDNEAVKNENYDVGGRGGAVYIEPCAHGNRNTTFINVYFEGNFAHSNGGAIDWHAGAMDGLVENATFINNTAGQSGGAIYWSGINGTIRDSMFVGNSALGDDKNGGGAVTWTGDVGLIEKSIFLNNTAKSLGGAILLKDHGESSAVFDVDLADSILKGNVASKGSAIYISNNDLEIINSVLLENRADSVELKLNVTRTNSNRTIEVICEFKGNDNLINAIWNDGTIALVNVTYLGVNGISNSGNSRIIPEKLPDNVKPVDNGIYQTQYEAYQDIVFYIYDKNNRLLAGDTIKTNNSGEVRYSFTSNVDKLYEFVFHPDDNYYTLIENSTSKLIAYAIIPTEDIFYLENESFAVSVVPKSGSEIPAGNVTVFVNGEKLDIFTLNDGKTAKITLSDLNAGTYNVTVNYTGDEKFFPRVNSTIFNVKKIASFVIATVENYTCGESGKIMIKAPQNENNTISIRLNGKTYEVKVNESGCAEFDIPELDFGVYDVQFTYPETNNYLKSANKTTFEIYPVINVNVVKSANVTEAYVLDLINFTITVSNDGQITAHDVVVSDKIADNLVIEDYADGGEILDGNVISWNIGDLNSGSKITLWIIVSPAINATFTNVASVNSTETGVNESNEVNVTVKPVVDLKITKNVNVTVAYVGDEITYTIEVYNNGIYNATNVKVTEKLSKSLELLSADTKYGYYDEIEGIWNIAKLNHLESAALTLTVRAVLSSTVENTVSVASDEKELNDNDNNYSCEKVTVLQKDAPIEIDVKDVSYGEAVIVTIKAPQDSNGTLNVTLCGETYNNVPCEDGELVFVYAHLAGGDYDVNVVFSGDNKYKPNSTSASFNVAKLTPEIKIEVIDIIEGEIEVLNVTSNAPGSVNITVNGITVEIPLDESVVTTDVLKAGALNYNGKATWRLINLAKGTYKVDAVYNANENYTAASASDVFHVKAEIKNAEVEVDDISVGETATVKVKYPGDATGYVTVAVNGRTYTKELKNGAATFKIPNLKAGSYDVEVLYDGDDKYLPNDITESFEVSKSSPKIDICAPKIKEGRIVELTVNLPKDAKGTVTLEIDGKYYTADVKNGKAVFNIPNLKFGDYSIAIHYSGDEKYSEEYAYATIGIDFNQSSDNGSSQGYHENIHLEGLAKYPTANPIIILLLAVLAIGFGMIKSFKKE